MPRKRSLEFLGFDGSALRVDTAAGRILGEWKPIEGKASTG